MLPPTLRADCTKCCGLCCVAPTFDASQGFGFDKPPRRACRNLHSDFRCAIHARLREEGFPACATFDCHGAGQRVTQKLFDGRSWRESPQLAQRMFDAYAKYRSLHELMALLEIAIRLASPQAAAPLREWLQRIDRMCETGTALDPSVRVGALRASVLAVVRAVASPQ